MLVFEYMPNANGSVSRTFGTFDDLEARYYMYQLLVALDFAHSNGIMHRDVKPQNIMYDSKAKKLRLIDWGLAEFYMPGQSYNVRVASRYYKAPELLFEDTHYHYGLDMWSAGCTMAEAVFQNGPLFMGENNKDQLV